MFKLGDEVIALESANSNYALTIEGSRGIVTKIHSSTAIRVQFTHIPGQRTVDAYDTYTVDPADFRLLKPKSGNPVLDKIKEIYAQQREQNSKLSFL